jgi:hypothetical protein
MTVRQGTQRGAAIDTDGVTGATLANLVSVANMATTLLGIFFNFDSYKRSCYRRNRTVDPP